jgi:endonuclease/exonuclease/phosphatase family metal-dependent hydrolase
VLFEIDLPQRVRPLRVLACDLESSPRVHRAPSLGAIAIIANELSRDSTPADVIAGDFNAPARAWGFADIERAADGYRRAAFWSGDWRATWPSAFAVLDIDHILVRRGVAVRSAALFTNHATDHRGQTVDLAISDAPKRSPTMRFMPKPIPEPSPRRASSR